MARRALAASRGLASSKPSGASRSSCSSTASSVRAAALSRSASDPRLAHQPRPLLDRHERRGSAAFRRGSRGRPARGRRRAPSANWSRWPNQPWIGVRSSGCSSSRDVEVGGRAGPGVEVLVGAADGQLDAPPLELDRHGAGRVARGPTAPARGRPRRDRAPCRRARRSGRRRGRARRARRRRRAGRLDVLGPGPSIGSALEEPQLAAVTARHALEHVAVGREVAGVGDDTAARPGVEHRERELEEVDGGGVGDDHLARPGAEDAPRRGGRRRARAARSTRASRRPARTPHWSITASQPLARGDAAGGRASCRRGRCVSGSSITKRSRNARQRIGGVEAPRRAARSVTVLQPCRHSVPSIDCSDRGARSGRSRAAPRARTASPASRGALGVAAGELGRARRRRHRRGPAAAARRAGAARSARRRRSGRELAQRPAEQLARGAARQPEPRRLAEVDHAGLGDGGGRTHARLGAGRAGGQAGGAPPPIAPGARRPSGRSTTTRARSSGTSRPAERSIAGGDVLERRGPAAAAAPAQAPVLEVPDGPAAPREVRHERVLQAEVVPGAPVAAVDQDGDGPGPLTPPGPRELAELIPPLAVGMPHHLDAEEYREAAYNDHLSR